MTTQRDKPGPVKRPERPERSERPVRPERPDCPDASDAAPRPSPQQWSGALDLLDQALQLPLAARAAWLDGLAPDQLPLRPLVRRLLDERAAIETAGFLQALPPLPSPAAGLDLAPGRAVGPYTLVQPLGQGGMASVWLARRSDGAHERPVALKLPYLGARSAVLAARFARERRILSSLAHPHIAGVLDAGADGHQPWLAMEYVDGQTITAWAAQQRLDPRARLRLFLQVLQAVSHAHSRLVIHRDLKPSNVLVDRQGQVKLLDFGVAKLLADDGEAADTELTQLGGRALTPHYASPEQVSGLPLGTSSDVYSLGVLLYELLTGRQPYTLQRATPAALEEAILTAQVALPSTAVDDAALRRALRGDVDAIVLKAMALRSADRYDSSQALAQDLQNHLEARPISARRAGWVYRSGRLLRRHAWAVGAGAAVVVALGAGLALAALQATEAQAQARRAQAVSAFLNDLFAANAEQQPDPLAAQQTPALALMDLGAQRIRSGFRDDPRTAEALLQTVAELYFGMGRYDRGEPLLAERVQVVRQQLGHDRLLLVRALISHAGGLWETKQIEALRATLAEAGRLLDALPDPDPLLRGHWHFLQGDLRSLEDVPGAGAAHYEQALAWFERAEARQPGSAEHRLNVMSTLVHTYTRAGRMDDARRMLAQAQQEGERLADRLPSKAAMVFSVAGRFHIADGRFEPAEAALRRALQLYRRVGGDAHAGVHITQLPLMQLLFLRGERDEALTTATQMTAAYARALGAGNVQTLNAQVQAARSRRLAGDEAAARQTLQTVLPMLQALPGQSVRTAFAWLDLAGLQCDRRDAVACADALARADTAAPGTAARSERLRWQQATVSAQLAALQGRWPDALQLQAESTRLARQSTQVYRWDRLWADGELGARALEAGRVDDARALVEPAWAELQADTALQALRPLRAQLLLRLAQLRLAQGQGAEALQAVTESLALRQQGDVPASPGWAEARTTLERAQRVFKRPSRA